MSPFTMLYFAATCILITHIIISWFLQNRPSHLGTVLEEGGGVYEMFIYFLLYFFLFTEHTHVTPGFPMLQRGIYSNMFTLSKY